MVIFTLEDGSKITSTESGNVFPSDSIGLQKLLSYQVGLFGHTIDPKTANPYDISLGLDSLGIRYDAPELPALKVSDEVRV